MNQKNNSYIVQIKNNNLISKSSSGGMFAEFAKYILSQNGVVFGCTMQRVEEGFEVKHIYIEKEEDLFKLQGSKYVQSSLGNTIKQAKEFLDKGRFVLFSGTPCQIAGLKAYLKQDYENLLTLDLSCTGTPNQEIFNDYIKFLESKYKQKILNFEFRNKAKMGWTCGNALITFKNGKQKILCNNVSSYLNLFINKKIQPDRCQNCKYVGLERVSDITIADAWGIDIEYPNLLKNKFDRNKGISLVLVNSEKADKVFNIIQNNIISEKININRLTKYNNPLQTHQLKDVEKRYINEWKKNGYQGLNNIFINELGLKYYYNILKNYTPKFLKTIIVKLLKKDKIDCLLVTGYMWPNYGSLLAAFSLQKVIEKLGFSNRIIHYAQNYGFSKKFEKKHLKVTKYCTTFNDLKRLNSNATTFVLGSDNLLNLKTNPYYFVVKNLLNYTNLDKKRMMISGSIGGWDGSTKTQEEHNYIKHLLHRFDYLSTREEHGKEVFKNVYDVEADWINDPVFYLKKEDYYELVKDVKEDYNKKIMQYILYPTEQTNSIVEYFMEKTGKQIVKFDGNDNVKCFSRYKGQFVENWLSAIINSDLIISDSFHCIAFSLIFNKPFICIKNTHATVRFTSLFKRLGINVPLIENVNDVETKVLDYNKEQVNKELFNIREFALSKIEEALLKQKVVTPEQIEQEKEFQKLNKKYLKNFDVWYKKNKLFYFGIIVPFVIPFLKIKKDICKK